MNISVVIPCYNAAAFICASLASVAEQTRPPAEVIVIDDGSTDASLEVVRAAELPVRLLQTDRKGGAGARNAGIDAAVGDWVAFLDADDLWYPNHLERAADVIQRVDPVGYINHYDHIDANGVGIRRRRCKVASEECGTGLDDYIALFARYGHFVGMSACLVETRRARAIGGLLESQRRRHDIEFWLRVVQGERWVFDPVATSAYRKNNPGGLSAGGASAGLDGFTAFLRHRDEAENLAAYDAVLRERARSALARSFEAKDDAARERAFEAAFDYLGPMHKLVFGVSRRVPGLFPVFRAIDLV